MGCYHRIVHSSSIHFQVLPPIVHPINRPPSTVHGPPLARPVLPSRFGFDRLSPRPGGPHKSGIACAYFRLPASPAIATTAVIDACTHQVCPRPRVSDSATRYVRCLLPSTPRPLSLPLVHRLRSSSRCHHPDSSSGTSRASMLLPWPRPPAENSACSALTGQTLTPLKTINHLGAEIDRPCGR